MNGKAQESMTYDNKSLKEQNFGLKLTDMVDHLYELSCAFSTSPNLLLRRHTIDMKTVFLFHESL